MALSRKECTPYHPYEEESAHLSEFHSVELFYYAEAVQKVIFVISKEQSD